MRAALLAVGSPLACRQPNWEPSKFPPKFGGKGARGLMLGMHVHPNTHRRRAGAPATTCKPCPRHPYTPWQGPQALGKGLENPYINPLAPGATPQISHATRPCRSWQGERAFRCALVPATAATAPLKHLANSLSSYLDCMCSRQNTFN